MAVAAAAAVVATAAMVSAAAARVPAAAAVAAEAGRRAWRRQLASQRPKRGSPLPWGRRRPAGVRKRQRELYSSYVPDRRPLGGPGVTSFVLAMGVDVVLYAPCRIALQSIPGGILGYGGLAACTVFSDEW